MATLVRDLIYESIRLLIADEMTDIKIKKRYLDHTSKVHFVPPQYRVLGRILQALNIRFGNFIEKLIDSIGKNDPKVSMHAQSGKRCPLRFTAETDSSIDTYITNRQLPQSRDICDEQFESLLSKIVNVENARNSEAQTITKDIDVLFSTSDGKFIFVEIKYNDDHDTGKFVDINRKFIKTYAGLVNLLGITSRQDLELVLYYFNPTKRYGPIYVPSKNIMRGPQLFDAYFETKYSEVDGCLREIGNDPDILSLFDSMADNVRSFSSSTI